MNTEVMNASIEVKHPTSWGIWQILWIIGLVSTVAGFGKSEGGDGIDMFFDHVLPICLTGLIVFAMYKRPWWLTKIVWGMIAFNGAIFALLAAVAPEEFATFNPADWGGLAKEVLFYGYILISMNAKQYMEDSKA